jgi:hypothetical protein
MSNIDQLDDEDLIEDLTRHLVGCGAANNKNKKPGDESWVSFLRDGASLHWQAL